MALKLIYALKQGIENFFEFKYGTLLEVSCLGYEAQTWSKMFYYRAQLLMALNKITAADTRWKIKKFIKILYLSFRASQVYNI